MEVGRANRSGIIEGASVGPWTALRLFQQLIYPWLEGEGLTSLRIQFWAPPKKAPHPLLYMIPLSRLVDGVCGGGAAAGPGPGPEVPPFHLTSLPFVPLPPDARRPSPSAVNRPVEGGGDHMQC